MRRTGHPLRIVRDLSASVRRAGAHVHGPDVVNQRRSRSSSRRPLLIARNRGAAVPLGEADFRMYFENLLGPHVCARRSSTHGSSGECARPAVIFPCRARGAVAEFAWPPRTRSRSVVFVQGDAQRRREYGRLRGHRVIAVLRCRSVASVDWKADGIRCQSVPVAVDPRCRDVAGMNARSSCKSSMQSQPPLQPSMPAIVMIESAASCLYFLNGTARFSGVAVPVVHVGCRRAREQGRAARIRWVVD